MKGVARVGALAALLLGAALGMATAPPPAGPAPAGEGSFVPAAADAPPGPEPARVELAFPQPTMDFSTAQGEAQWRMLPSDRGLGVALQLAAPGVGRSVNASGGWANVVAPNGTTVLSCSGAPCAMEDPVPLSGVWRLRMQGGTGTLGWVPGAAGEGSDPLLYAANLTTGERRVDGFLVGNGSPGFTLDADPLTPVPPPMPGVSAIQLADPAGSFSMTCFLPCHLPVKDPAPGWWTLQYVSGFPVRTTVLEASKSP